MNPTTVLELRPVPRTDVHRVRGAAEDILAVLGIGNLSSGSPVEDGTTPSVDVDGEASGVDITGKQMIFGGVTKGREKSMRR